MFIPKGETTDGVAWNETMFWNVYYVKGAFLNADAAFEVIQGMRTLAVRMLQQVHQHGDPGPILRLASQHPRPLQCARPTMKTQHCASAACFSVAGTAVHDRYGCLPAEVFQRFFDSLEPMFAHMISLGQSNTIVSCPA